MPSDNRGPVVPPVGAIPAAGMAVNAPGAQLPPVQRRVGLGPPIPARPAPSTRAGDGSSSAATGGTGSEPASPAAPLVGTTAAPTVAVDGASAVQANASPETAGGPPAPTGTLGVAPVNTAPPIQAADRPPASGSPGDDTGPAGDARGSGPIPALPVPARSGPVAPSGPRPSPAPAVGVLGARPLATASVQRTGAAAAPVRSPATAEAPPVPLRRGVEAMTGVGLGDVGVDRSPRAATAAAQLGARAFATGGMVHVPAALGPLTSGTGAATTAHELVHVAQQRTYGAALPPEASAGGRRLEAVARSTEATVLAADRPDAAPAPPADWSIGSDPGSAAVAAGIARRAEDGSIVFSPAADAPVQRSVDAAPVQRVGEPSPGASPGGGEQDNEHLEQLAKQLYDKIRDRLRAELRLDRERCGRITDLSR